MLNIIQRIHFLNRISCWLLSAFCFNYNCMTFNSQSRSMKFIWNYFKTRKCQMMLKFIFSFQRFKKDKRINFKLCSCFSSKRQYSTKQLFWNQDEAFSKNTSSWLTQTSRWMKSTFLQVPMMRVANNGNGMKIFLLFTFQRSWLLAPSEF